MDKLYCHVVPPIWTVRHPDQASGWLTEYVRRQGYEVQMVDLNAELFCRETRAEVKDCWLRHYDSMDPPAFVQAVLERHGRYVRERLRPIVERGCRVFGMMTYDGNARFACRLSQLIKQLAPDAHVIAGGTGVTSVFRFRRRYGRTPPFVHPMDDELLPDHAIDSWCLGEGEYTLVEVLERLRTGQSLEGMPGLVLEREGPFAPFRERPLIKELDSLPFPTYEGFDISLYLYRSLPYQLTRGCYYSRCAYCGLRGYSRGFRVRSPEHAVAELRHHIERLGVREFHFTDLAINGDLAKLEAICDEVIRSKLNIRWQGFARIRPDMTPELMHKIAAAGCMNINYGLETGSDVVLQVMRKGYTAADAARMLRMTKEAGMEVVINIMCGHPGETEEELQRTLAFLADNAENIDMVAGAVFTAIHAHAPMIDECDAFGIEIDGRARWRSVDGQITREVRNERVHRVAEHLRILGIPCFVGSWEIDRPERPEEAPASEVRWVSVSQVQVVSPHGPRPDRIFPVDESVLVRVGYQASPAVRGAVFDLEIVDAWGRVVFATPSASEDLRTIEVAPHGWVQMALAHHDLLPGRYLVAVQVRPPRSQEVYDRHLYREAFEIVGVSRPRCDVLCPYTFTHHPFPLQPVDDSPVVQLRLADRSGAGPGALRLGDPIDVTVGLADRRLGDPTLRLRLWQDGRCLHETDPASLDLSQPRLWQHTLQSAGLAPGLCELELELAAAEATWRSRHLLTLLPPDAPGETGVDLAPEATWTVLDAAPQPSPDGPGVVAAELLDRPEDGVTPGSAITLRLVAAGVAAGARTVCRVWVSDSYQRTVGSAHAVAEVVSPAGAVRLDLRLQVNLLEGAFELHGALWDPVGDGPRGRVWTFPLVVRGIDRRQGGGLVFAPHRLTTTAA